MAKNYVGIAGPSLIYILLDDRADFDKIATTETDGGDKGDGGHVLVKSVEQPGVTVVIQHWIKSPVTKTEKRARELAVS